MIISGLNARNISGWFCHWLPIWWRRKTFCLSHALPTNDASKFSHKSCLQMSAVENNFCWKLDQIKFLSFFCHLGSNLKGNPFKVKSWFRLLETHISLIDLSRFDFWVAAGEEVAQSRCDFLLGTFHNQLPNALEKGFIFLLQNCLSNLGKSSRKTRS